MDAPHGGRRAHRAHRVSPPVSDSRVRITRPSRCAANRDAVKLTLTYYQSRWAEDRDAVPRLLWNAKMRFGKTFTTYQLANS